MPIRPIFGNDVDWLRLASGVKLKIQNLKPAMLMLVSYDVNTVNASGRRRLRRIAKACEDWGIRVQNSVFECRLDWAQWITLKAKLESICDADLDSLRYYNLGNNYQTKVVHYGANPTIDPAEDALVV